MTTRSILIIFMFALLMGCTFGFGLDLVSAIIPDIKAGFQLSDSDLGFLTGFGRLGFVIGAILSGIISAFVASTVIVLAASLGCALGLFGLYIAETSAFISVAIFWISACTALSWVPMAGVFVLFVPERHRAKAFGAIIAGAGIGTSSVGLLVPYFIEHHSWRASLLAAALTTVVAVGLALVVTLRAGLITRKEATDHIENNVALIRLRDVVSVRLIGVFFMFFLVGFTVHPFQIFMSTYIRTELGFEAIVAGNAWLTIGLVGTWAGLAMGYLGDRIGIRETMVLSAILLAVACMLLIKLHDPIWFVTAAFVFSLSYYAMPGLLPAFLSISYPERISVQLFSVGSTVLGVGTVIGNVVGGQLSETFGSLAAYYLVCMGAGLVLAFCATIFMSQRERKARVI